MLLALTVAGQTLFLGGMIAVDSAPYVFGETIRLKVQPVDPRDLFRGDYVILGYDFSRQNSGAWNGDSSNSDVFVVLKKSADENYWEMDHLTAEQPESGTFIHGQREYYGSIQAGIEAYYVQEGQGRQIENAIRGRRPVFAEVAVWQGKAKLRRVVVE
jgi:uncharacterized membrane-anchored protein